MDKKTNIWYKAIDDDFSISQDQIEGFLELYEMENLEDFLSYLYSYCDKELKNYSAIDDNFIDGRCELIRNCIEQYFWEK